MLTVEGLGMRYGGPNGHVLFEDLSFTLPPGGRLAVLGRNGQGKSSLIKILGGVLAPSRGRVAWGMSPSWPLGFAGGFQGSLTGLDNIRFISRIYGQPIEETIRRTDDFAELGDALQQPLKQYSSGMRARLAFGLSLAIEFDCYLIDEVIAVGDSAFQRRCQDELFNRRADRAFVIASHDLALIKRTCDRAILIEDGQAKLFDDIDMATEIARGLGRPGGADQPSAKARTTGEITWPREMFNAGDTPYDPCPPTIDVTGAARILVFGPYAAVPPGRWRLTARFELDRHAATGPFLLEFGQGANLAGAELNPAGEGLYEISIEQTLSGKTPAEMRLWLARPRFHGALRFLGASLERLDDGAGKAPSKMRRTPR
jgi:capsular polysaccharide transport system ATP-binding protein